MDRIRRFGESAFASLSIRNYRLYFYGQAVSLSGTWMQTVALGWLGLQLTGSGSQLGFIVSVQFLPMLLLGPWGGIVADRFNKRTILYFTQVAFLTISFAVGLLVYFDMVQVWMLYAAAASIGFVRLFDNPTRQSLVSEIVGPEHLKNAISLNATVNNLARAIGPSIGGLIIVITGLAFCFFFNAITYLYLIYLLSKFDVSEMHRAPSKGSRHSHLVEGWLYVRETLLIRHLLIMVAIMGTFTYEFQISLAIFARQTFNSDASGYAALMAAFGAGAALGGIVSASRKESGVRLFLIFSTLFGLTMILTAFMPTLRLAVAAMVLVGFFSINTLSLANSMIQLESKPDMRGRVMALWGMAVMGTTPIGGPIIGWIGEYFGARLALGVGGFAALAAVAYGFVVLIRKEKLVIIEETELAQEHVHIS